tara:strand:- start:437 stop:688 length:252 start_codon:yes stop_codon:yes gene_type:complete
MLNLLHAGQAVTCAQNQAGITSVEFARRAKTSPQQVIRWRSQENIKLHTIQLICKCTGISISKFLEFCNQAKPVDSFDDDTPF